MNDKNLQDKINSYQQDVDRKTAVLNKILDKEKELFKSLIGRARA